MRTADVEVGGIYLCNVSERIVRVVAEQALLSGMIDPQGGGHA